MLSVVFKIFLLTFEGANIEYSVLKRNLPSSEQWTDLLHGFLINHT